MKYSYVYKTSDGTRHVDSIESETRDAAFAALRAGGIRPIKVMSMDGTKANGEVRIYGVRKSAVSALVLAAAGIATIIGLSLGRRTAFRGERLDARAGGQTGALLTALPRQQIGGLPAETLMEPDVSDVERFLAKVAQPARSAVFRREDTSLEVAESLVAFLDAPVSVSPGASPELVELKRIIMGLQDEARLILASGRSALEVLQYFADRQKMEIEHRKRMVEKVESGILSKGDANAVFRAMGFPEIK